MGQFLAQGPYFPLLELQARWIMAVWSGEVELPAHDEMRRVVAHRVRRLDAHNALAPTPPSSSACPEPVDWPQLAEPLTFGPLLPPRYRLSGPGAEPEAAAARFTEQLAASPRSLVDPADLDALRGFGSGPTGGHRGLRPGARLAAPTLRPARDRARRRPRPPPSPRTLPAVLRAPR